MERVVVGAEPGPVLTVRTLGAGLDRLEVAGGDGVRRDVVREPAAVGEATTGPAYWGAVIGRCANRTAYGDLPLPGGGVTLPVNDRGHHLHGGPDGFDARHWRVVRRSPSSVRLVLVSPDGDQGYPGEVRITATYAVRDDGFALELVATTDAPTVVNPTHHPYLNLAGSGEVGDHLLRVAADSWTPTDGAGIPTGELAPLAGTRLDLRTPRRLGDVGELDDNFVVGDAVRRPRPVAELSHPATRTRATLTADLPGLQVFTGRPAGIALEPQFFPDAVHHPSWPSPLLRPGETYRTRLRWRFGRLAAGDFSSQAEDSTLGTPDRACQATR